MPSIVDSLRQAADRAGELLPLAAVPLVVTLLHPDRLRALLRPTDRVLSVTFGFPRDVATLWSFLNVQAEGPSVAPVDAVVSVPAFLGRTLAVATVASLLAAGYLGSIDATLDGHRRDFVDRARAHAVPFLGFGYLEAGVFLAVALGGVLARPLVLPLLVGALGLAYLFFATPYLVVAEELSLVPALSRSLGLALSDARYLGFFLGYVVVNAAISLPVSALAFTNGPGGVALAALVTAPVALVLNTATLVFVRSLDGGEPAPAQSNMPVDM